MNHAEQASAPKNPRLEPNAVLNPSEPHCRRETPITLPAPDGTLVEGAVDLAFLDDGACTVVDFKTDQELATHLDVYRRQVALYAQAIAAATGAPAHAVLMRL